MWVDSIRFQRLRWFLTVGYFKVPVRNVLQSKLTRRTIQLAFMLHSSTWWSIVVLLSILATTIVSPAPCQVSRKTWILPVGCWKVVCWECNLRVTWDRMADVVHDSGWRSTYSESWDNLGSYISDKVVNDSTLTHPQNCEQVQINKRNVSVQGKMHIHWATKLLQCLVDLECV